MDSKKNEINLYDVLGLKHNASSQNIKNAYRKLIPTHHPDKGGDPDLFELITHAFNVLYNPQSRGEYDELRKISKQSSSDYSSLKKAADDFFKAQDITEEEYEAQKEDATKNYEKDYHDLDRKHGFKREDSELDFIDEEVARKRLDDLEMVRKQDEIELHQEKIFDDGQFNLAKFNALFDQMHKRNDEMVPHTGNPSAFNGADGLNFSSYANTYDTLYDETDYVGGSNDSSIKLNNAKSNKKISKQDVRNIQGADYVTGHSKKDPEYNRTLEQMLKERENYDINLNKRTMADWDTDPNMDGYGIFNEVGLTGKEFDWTIEPDEAQKRYERLLELRNSENKAPKTKNVKKPKST